ncbi:hypothetical protein KHA80_05255 [Anaerobacillus sp. HL2]|nr:hypothetical protein KHA80_05255 [Anaerobacillus sp. HL2]
MARSYKPIRKRTEDKPMEIRSYQDYRGIDVIGTYAWTNNHNWLIVGKVDKTEVLQPFFRTTSTMVVISLFVLILSYLFITKIHKAIQQSLNYIFGRRKSDNKRRLL